MPDFNTSRTTIAPGIRDSHHYLVDAASVPKFVEHHSDASYSSQTPSLPNQSSLTDLPGFVHAAPFDHCPAEFPGPLTVTEVPVIPASGAPAYSCVPGPIVDTTTIAPGVRDPYYNLDGTTSVPNFVEHHSDAYITHLYQSSILPSPAFMTDSPGSVRPTRSSNHPAPTPRRFAPAMRPPHSDVEPGYRPFDAPAHGFASSTPRRAPPSWTPQRPEPPPPWMWNQMWSPPFFLMSPPARGFATPTGSGSDFSPGIGHVRIQELHSQ